MNRRRFFKLILGIIPTTLAAKLNFNKQDNQPDPIVQTISTATAIGADATFYANVTFGENGVSVSFGSIN